MRSILALASVAAAVAAVLHDESSGNVSERWRGQHANAVRSAILADLLTLAEGVPERPQMTVCIALRVGTGEGSAEVSVDPPPEITGQLVLGLHPIVPISRCGVDNYMLVDSDGAMAVLLEVEELRWITADFVKARARWHRGAVSDAGYAYTVSRTSTGWSVDTAKLLWFA